MSDTINIWIALSEQAVDVLRPLLDDVEYSGEHLIAVNIFRKMIDISTVQKMFKTPTIASKKWILFNVYLRGDRRVKNALDYLEENYPNQFEVIGAWWMDGRQVGTEWELDENDEYTGNVIGDPIYPIHSRVLDFLPDNLEFDEEGNVIGSTPTLVFKQVNLLQGQMDRRFE